MADSKIIIEVAVQGDAEVRLKKIGEEAEKAGKQSTKAFADAGRIFDNFIANIASSATQAAFSQLQQGVHLLTDFLLDSVRAASEAEDNINKLRVSLQSAGITSKNAADKFIAFADAMQASTKYSDDAILSAGSLLETIAKLDEDGLEKATLAAANLATALRIDLDTAAQALGKTAVGESSILNKYGFELDKAKSNAENFARALEFVNDFAGGAAAQELNTFSGATTQLANNFDNLQEAIGNIIIQDPVVIGFFKELSDIIVNVTKGVTENDSATRAFAHDGLLLLVSGAELAALALNEFYKITLTVANGVLGTIRVIAENTPFLRLTKGFEDTAKNALDAQDAIGGMLVAARDRTPLTDLAVQAELLKIRIREMGDEAGNAAVRATQAGNQQLEAARSQGTALTEAQLAEIEKRKNEIVKKKQEEIDLLLAQTDLFIAMDQEAKNHAHAEEIAANFAKAQAIADTEEKLQKKKAEIQKKEIDFNKQTNEQLQRDKIDSLNRIATLATAKSKELQVIGKAAAISTATIDGVIAVQKALASSSPPFNFILAGLVGVATAANVAKIAGIPLATGITEVPPGYPNDTFSASLTSGERVVDQGTNQDLKAFLAGGGSQNQVLSAIYARLLEMEMRVNVFIGNRQIVEEVRYGLQAGRDLDVAI